MSSVLLADVLPPAGRRARRRARGRRPRRARHRRPVGGLGRPGGRLGRGRPGRRARPPGTTTGGCAEFLAWARPVERITPLLNGADVFAWNADKAYLIDLGHRRPRRARPRSLDDSNLVSGLQAALDR